MKYPRVAIVTTLCNAEHILPSFVRYHLLAGFDHLFLFFDDPKDEILYKRVAQLQKTTCFMQGPELQKNWKKVRHRVAPHLYDFVWKEAMARQQLNVGIAIEACLIQGIDWLLHIDVDELFFSSDISVNDHFRALDEQGAFLCHYFNYEAIPEAFDILDFFKESTLFKINAAFSKSHKHSDNLLAGLPQIPPKFFHFYSNGKTAAKVTESLIVHGVHSFGFPEEVVSVSAPQSQVILHYPCCGFNHFWDKYKTLGTFGDAWYGKVDIRSRTGPTHLESRDVVTSGSLEKARQFYQNRFMIEDPHIAQELIDTGRCLRVTRIQEVLND